MLILVIELYVGVFQMLCGYMDWLQMTTLKRIWKSCSGNYYDDNVEAPRKQIEESIRQIEREADFVMQSRVYNLMEDRMAQRNIGRESRHDDVVTSQERLNQFGQMLGVSNVLTLGSVEQQVVHGKSAPYCLRSS